MAVLGCQSRLREWFQPVVSRPIRSRDRGTRLRPASVAAAAAACFVWIDGAVAARQVRDAAKAKMGMQLLARGRGRCRRLR
eukprot:11634426-Alexandrium_andersonii.AAC.1